MDIWLNTNMKAHEFIPKQYWTDNYEPVKGVLPDAEVYVFEADNQVKAFVGMDSGYIAGIFVSEEMQSRGIGKALLEQCKKLNDTLSLSVYEKNRGAVKFYMREGFAVDKRQADESTGEIECLNE